MSSGETVVKRSEASSKRAQTSLQAAVSRAKLRSGSWSMRSRSHEAVVRAGKPEWSDEDPPRRESSLTPNRQAALAAPILSRCHRESESTCGTVGVSTTKGYVQKQSERVSRGNDEDQSTEYRRRRRRKTKERRRREREVCASPRRQLRRRET